MVNHPPGDQQVKGQQPEHVPGTGDKDQLIIKLYYASIKTKKYAESNLFLKKERYGCKCICFVTMFAILVCYK